MRGLVMHDDLVGIDLDPIDLRIVACPHCPDWQAELVELEDHHVIREWHHRTCPAVVDAGRAATSTPVASPHIGLDHAVGLIMAFYGLSAAAAERALRLRATQVNLTAAELAEQILAHSSELHVESQTRRRASALFDEIGAG